MRSSLLPCLLLCLAGIVQALSAAGSRLLVLLDEQEDKTKYSSFLGDLEGRGFAVSIQSPKSDPALFKHGARAYDHLLILPSKLKALGPALTPNLLLEFVKEDGNILLALSADTPTPSTLISLLLELDIHLSPDRSALVVDHFNYDAVSAEEGHDVLLLPYPKPLRDDVKNYFGGDGLIAFPRGVGQTLGNASPLLAPILRAPPTAYSYNPKEEAEVMEDPFATGAQLSLISSMQARNSARFTVLGSAAMLENNWFDAKVQSGTGQQVSTGNRDFVAKVAGWTFKELGVLKVGRLQHYVDEGLGFSPSNDSSVDLVDVNPKMYRIKNEVKFSIEISEYSLSHYTPFQLPLSDALQLEFTMLSPYHRLTLQPASRTSNSTIYTASFRLPDQHGIFNFRVNYKRPFLTTVDEKHTVTVRHFAHDEWPRSWRISGAWVWIAGVWTTVGGWLIFVLLWLYSEPTDAKRNIKKSQ